MTVYDDYSTVFHDYHPTVSDDHSLTTSQEDHQWFLLDPTVPDVESSMNLLI
jgi:hypothetical protein